MERSVDLCSKYEEVAPHESFILVLRDIARDGCIIDVVWTVTSEKKEAQRPLRLVWTVTSEQK